MVPTGTYLLSIRDTPPRPGPEKAALLPPSRAPTDQEGSPYLPPEAAFGAAGKTLLRRRRYFRSIAVSA